MTDEIIAGANAGATPPRRASAAARKPARWTMARRETFIARLAESGNVTAAAKAARMPRSAAYRLRRTSAPFAAAWDEAIQVALDALEAAMLERAINGVEKTVYYGGQQCGTVRHYSDAAAMFILRSRRPEIYARPQTERDSPETADPVAEARQARAAIEARLDSLARGDAPMPEGQDADDGTDAADRADGDG
ncbi:hypothetical protein [Parapedomonas caeni]|jgi:hypothetical protein